MVKHSKAFQSIVKLSITSLYVPSLRSSRDAPRIGDRGIEQAGYSRMNPMGVQWNETNETRIPTECSECIPDSRDDSLKDIEKDLPNHRK